MRRGVVARGIAALVAALLATPLAGQQSEALSKGYDLERRGNYAGAEAIYLGVLDQRPADLGALLGLERVLVPLNRPTDLVTPLRAALAADSTQGIIYGIAIRTWTSMGQPDSVRLAALRWARQHPDDDAPYREWGAAMLAMQNRAGARQAYTMGRERLGKSDALAAELAQLAVQEQNYREATKEWIVAVGQLGGYRGTAVSTLSPAPPAMRPELLAMMDAAPGPAGRAMAIDLRARWGDPLGALQRLMAGLPGNAQAARDQLQQFLAVLRPIATRDAVRARARVYEALADRVPAAQQPSVRLEAARLYGEGGEPADARRMLSLLAKDRSSPAIAVGAAATLIELLVAADSIEAAAAQLASMPDLLDAAESARLNRLVASGWMTRGSFARADSMVATDSSVDGLALRGRLALVRGDLKGASAALREAGPFAGTQAEATERAALLALLQPIEQDSMPELGAAFLALARRDTAGAVDRFAAVAAQLPPAKGGAELLVYAGRLDAAQGQPAAAESLFRKAVTKEAPGAAAAAELELGRLYLALARPKDAIAVLEDLVLNYSGSPLVPQARRLLDVAKGAVPET
jgi:hypothetical protein